MKTTIASQTEKESNSSDFLNHTTAHARSDSFKKISEQLFLRDVPIVLLEEKKGIVSYDFLISDFPQAFQMEPAFSEVKSANVLQEHQRVLVYSRSMPKPVELKFSSKGGREAFSQDLYLHELASWPQKTSTYNSPESLVDMAAIFKAGYHVPKNDTYSATLLGKPLSERLPGLLAESLCFSVLKEKHLPITKALLELKADPNRMSSDSSFPLHEALNARNEKAAILLLKAGAINQRDYNGDSALDLFHEKFDKETASNLYALLEKSNS